MCTVEARFVLATGYRQGETEGGEERKRGGVKIGRCMGVKQL